MISLYITATAIIALAVALLIRPSPEFQVASKLRTADQRGITLQTLIVTAVLVLMAVAAGVVIVAITNNAQQDLEDQQSSIDSRCEPWEIYDTTLAAAGRGNNNGGIQSSAIGCLRVCYVSYKAHTADRPVTTGDLQAKKDASASEDVDLKDANAPANVVGVLRFDRSDISKGLSTQAAATDHILPVSGDRNVDTNGNTFADADTHHKVKISKIDGKTGTSIENLVIRVATNQKYCQVWNTTTDKEEFRSSS